VPDVEAAIQAAVDDAFGRIQQNALPCFERVAAAMAEQRRA
jgi:hypothetical protein